MNTDLISKKELIADLEKCSDYYRKNGCREFSDGLLMAVKIAKNQLIQVDDNIIKDFFKKEDSDWFDIDGNSDITTLSDNTFL